LRGLPILIRLARQRADSHRTALAEAECQTGLAAEVLAAHDALATAEAARASGKATQLAAWTDWARQSQRRRRGLVQALGQLRVDEDALRATLREAFAETKRLEIAADSAAQAARLQAARKAERAAEDAELLRRC
jgi:hypothetical protein